MRVLLLCFASTGCASGGVQVARPDRPDPVGVQFYETSVPSVAPARQQSGALVDAVASAVAPAGLRRDPRLDVVAAQILSVRPLQAPGLRRLDALMRHAGLVEPVPIFSAAAGPEAGVSRTLGSDLSAKLLLKPLTHYGVAVRSDPDKGAAVVVLLSQRSLELDPVPRSVPAGASVRLRGRVDDELRKPRWIVTPPAGDVQRLAATSEGTGFTQDIALEDRGVYRIELVADGPGGVTVVANFPVWCAEPPPPVDGRGPEQAVRGGMDAAAVEARLHELLARERSAANRAPLRRSDRLDALARAHCEDMRDAGFVGHTSPTTGEPGDRIRAAGISAWLIRENVGRGYSAEEIHEGLMQSPGHRDNILSRDADRLGLAIVEVEERPRPSFLATELFVSMAQPVDTARARQQVLRHIAEARRAAGMRPAKPEDGLMRAAQVAASRYFRESIDQEGLLSQAVGEAPLPRGCKQVGGSVTVLRSLGQLRTSRLGLEPAASHMGVGVAQGERPDGDRHALVLVVLYGL